MEGLNTALLGGRVERPNATDLEGEAGRECGNGMVVGPVANRVVLDGLGEGAGAEGLKRAVPGVRPI